MKITCNREKMWHAFQTVSSVAPSRSPKPILQNVKLEVEPDGAILMATDLEVGIRYRVAGIDGNFVLFDILTLFGFFAESESGDKKDSNQAYQGQARWRSDTVEVDIHRLSIGKNFSPETGYIRRNDTTKHLVRFGWRPRPGNKSWIRQYHLTTTHTWFTSHRDFMECRYRKYNFYIKCTFDFPTNNSSVSYTHLTLPTNYLV